MLLDPLVAGDTVVCVEAMLPPLVVCMELEMVASSTITVDCWVVVTDEIYSSLAVCVVSIADGETVVVSFVVERDAGSVVEAEETTVLVDNSATVFTVKEDAVVVKIGKDSAVDIDSARSVVDGSSEVGCCVDSDSESAFAVVTYAVAVAVGSVEVNKVDSDVGACVVSRRSDVVACVTPVVRESLEVVSCVVSVVLDPPDMFKCVMAVVIGLSVIDNCESLPLVGVSSSVEGTPVGVETTFVVGRFDKSPVLSAVASLDDCVKSIADVTSVADLEGVQGVRSNPPLEPNFFIFMENFNKFCLKLGKRTPLLYI